MLDDVPAGRSARTRENSRTRRCPGRSSRSDARTAIAPWSSSTTAAGSPAIGCPARGGSLRRSSRWRSPPGCSPPGALPHRRSRPAANTGRTGRRRPAARRRNIRPCVVPTSSASWSCSPSRWRSPSDSCCGAPRAPRTSWSNRHPRQPRRRRWPLPPRARARWAATRSATATTPWASPARGLR